MENAEALVRTCVANRSPVRQQRHSSACYRFRKFGRRNRATLTTVVCVVVVLMLGTIVSSWQAIRARRAERLAKANAARAANEEQKALAGAAAERAAMGLDPALRDPTAAMAFARRAVQLAPRNPRTQLALGMALYRTGDWSRAIDALGNALEAWPPQDAGGKESTLFFLAMAQAQLHNEKDAREYYRQAVRTMDSSIRARHVYARAIRAEATALLNISG